MIPHHVEICVVGGGPAGSAIARRLAQLGHEVLVLERAPGPRPHVGESLPPSILPLLEALGVRERVEDSGFLRPRGALIRWAGAPRQREIHGAEAGFQVDRGCFDSLLLSASEEAGARICRGWRARSARRSEDSWTLRIEKAGAHRRLTARYLVDATGRAGTLIRRRRSRLAATTLALYGYWRGTSWAGAETRIEAGDAAWFWGAPLPDGSFNATVFVDPRRPRDEGLEPSVLYHRLLETSELLRGCLAGELISPIAACDATSQVSADPIFEGGLRVGESCYAIDPLSSQGVQSALRSALQAAVVVHTLLDAPSRVDLATGFYRQRVGESVSRHRRMAGEFYAAEARVRTGSEFWQKRAGEARREEAIRSARAAPAPNTRLLLHREARLRPTPVLVGEHIEERPALIHPSLDRPLAFFAGQGIDDLLAALGRDLSPLEARRRWSRRIGPAAADGLFQQLWQNRVLIAADASDQET